MTSAIETSLGACWHVALKLATLIRLQETQWWELQRHPFALRDPDSYINLVAQHAATTQHINHVEEATA